MRALRSWRPLLLVSLSVGVMAANCNPNTTGEGEDTDAGPALLCVSDNDCGSGSVCRAGECRIRPPERDASTDTPDAGGQGDGGEGADAAVPMGILEARPDDTVEFGGQRLGIPVERRVFFVNVGDAPLTIFVIALDDNASGEFTATPLGNMNVTLNPLDELDVTVTHTPLDGEADTAQLKAVHSGAGGGIASVELVAEFKGVPAISLTNEIEVLYPNAVALDLGAVPMGAENDTTLFVRNQGSSDSVLTLTGIQLTPDNVGFSLIHPDVADGVLSAFIGRCPNGPQDCPAGFDTCTNGICVDDTGTPPDTFPIQVRFAPTTLGDASATLTVLHGSGADAAQTNVSLSARGIAGQLALTPSMLMFAETFVGRVYQADATVSNVGEAPTALTGLALAGDPSFTLVGAPPNVTLQPGDDVVLTFQFTPTAPGTVDAQATILHDGTEPLVLALSGVAALEPEILLPADLPFGGVYVGTSASRQVSIRNGGPGVLHIQSISVEGPQAGRFTISPTSFPDPLDPLLDVDATEPAYVVNVSYHPEEPLTAVNDTAALVIVSNDPDNTRAEVPLSGLAIQPVIVAQPTSLDFQSVRQGTTSISQLISVRNNGFGTLMINDVTLPQGSPFTVTPDRPLPALLSLSGPPLELSVTFTPATQGAHTDNLVITSSDEASPSLVVSLLGTGVQGQISVSPTQLLFPEVFIGRPAQATVTVTNTGDASLTLQGVTMEGSTAFTLAAGAASATLQPQGSTTLTFQFLPTDPGPVTGRALVAHDSGAAIPVDLSGTGRLEPTIVVPTSLSFGERYVGTSATLPLSIRNQGPGELRILSILLEGPGAARFTLSPTTFADPLQPLANGNDPTPNFEINVAYHPQAPVTGTTDAATVVILSDDPDNGRVEVPVSGTAVQPDIVVQPSLVNFDVVTVDVAASPQIINVYNDGPGTLVITDVSLPSGTPFSMTVLGSLPASLQFGSPPLQIEVGFTPPAAVPYSATVTITSNDGAVPTTEVTLIGSGRPCPSVPGTSFTQVGASCTYACLTDYWDLDGDLNTANSNGCEYGCVFQGGLDVPDDGFVDFNCDGIDGDPDDAVFVSPSGVDGAPGTRTQPLSSVEEALTLAAGSGRDVYIAQGSYGVDGTLSVVNGVSLYGGFSQDFATRSNSAISELLVNSATAVLAQDITGATVLDRLSVVGTDAATGSAYGVRAINSPGLVLNQCTVEAGRGAVGGAGSSVAGTATVGGNGGQGQEGCEDSGGFCSGCSQPQGGGEGSSVCGMPGGGGGSARKDGNYGNAGAQGAGGTPAGAGTPPHQGNWEPTVQYRGTNGANGSPGAEGSPGSPSYAASGYSPSNGQTGDTGSPGAGGGGGGGGGGGESDCNSYGGGGGGGGGGGCGGAPGTGGRSGGGSFAVYLWASNVSITSCTLRTRGGANGGDGGTGQVGGDGGRGGRRSDTSNAGNPYGGSNEQDDGSNGGRGGDGGKGGRGGHGGGGAGGPSVGVLVAGGATPALGTNTFSLGTAGSGGSSLGNDGPTGVRADVHSP
ncbi:MAG: choice-of-anchor D domain-containing protein [Myxococcota bacterium]